MDGGVSEGARRARLGRERRRRETVEGRRERAPSGLASTSFCDTARTPSMMPSTVGDCCAATAWISVSVVCLASATDESGNCRRLSFVVKSSSAAWMLACPVRPMTRRASRKKTPRSPDARAAVAQPPHAV